MIKLQFIHLNAFKNLLAQEKDNPFHHKKEQKSPILEGKNEWKKASQGVGYK